MKYYTVASENDNGDLRAQVFNSEDIEDIIESLGGDILLIAEGEHQANLFAEGFNDGIQRKPPRFYAATRVAYGGPNQPRPNYSQE